MKTETDARSAGEALPAPTLVWDGRGTRLQESLNKSLDDIQGELENLELGTDENSDAAEMKKTRAQRNRLLGKHTSSLKNHLKRVQDSANRAALQRQEERILELQDLVVACQSLCTAFGICSWPRTYVPSGPRDLLSTSSRTPGFTH